MSTPTSASTEANIQEPTEPGTSAKLFSGRPYLQYLVAFVLALTVLNACYAALGSILIPNTIQTIEFQQVFGDATYEGNAITADTLNQISEWTAADPSTLSAEQQELVDLKNSYEASRAADMSMLMAVGALFTIFAQPLVGVFSDRWRSRRGRRAFWIVLGAIAGALFMVGLRYSTNLALLITFWTTTQVALNFMQGPLSTTVADRIPTNRVATVSGFSGIGMMGGVALGSFVAGILVTMMGLDTYFVFALAVIIGALLFVTFAKDRSSEDLVVEKFDWVEFAKGFTIALRDRDFRWVWIARFMMYFGYMMVVIYNFFVIQNHLGQDPVSANHIVAGISAAALPGQLLVLYLSGKFSDRIGKRKPFVIGASLLIAADMLVPLLFPTVPAYYFFYILLSAAMGVYMAVDVALFIDVLPDPAAAGRDLGVANIATNIGQMLSPVVGGWVVGLAIAHNNFGLSSNYAPVFVVAAAAVAISAIAIVPVKKVA